MGAPAPLLFFEKIVIGILLISPNWLLGGEEGVGLGPAWRRRQRSREDGVHAFSRMRKEGPAGAAGGRLWSGPFLAGSPPSPGARTLNQFGRAGRAGLEMGGEP